MDAKTEQQTDAPIDDEAADFEAGPEGSEAPVEETPISLEHTLTRPIMAHGDEIKVLHWREPTGGDIERAGNPVYLDFSGPSPTMTFNEKKMANMISVLCAIPPSAVRSMTAKDWNAVAWKLFRFFTPPGA